MSNYNSVTGGNFDVSNAFIGAAGGIGAALGPVLSTVGGFIDSAANRKAAKENTDKTIAAQKAESELAYQRAIEMWNLQNQYNSPQAQMARFGQAGLNPNLIYQQGNAGNASSPPNYQPAQQQYGYVGGKYGQALASILPMMMQVGTWMQQMRLSETRINQGETSIDKMEQMIDYLERANPELLNKLKEQVEVLGYQKDSIGMNTAKAHAGIYELLGELTNKYGYNPSSLGLHRFGEISGDWKAREGSEVRLTLDKLAKELEIKGYDAKLKEAQSSWTQFDITNPQAIMQMVFGAAMGLAGQTMKIGAGKANPRVNQSQKKLTRSITNYERSGKRVVKRNFYE